MSLPFDPSLLPGTSGNALANTSLKNYPTSPSSVNFNVDFSNVLGGYLQIWNIGGGSVNATNGAFVQVYSSPDGGSNYDTIAFPISWIFPTIASTAQRQSVYLDTGKYQVNVWNQDPANSINVMATTGLLT